MKLLDDPRSRRYIDVLDGVVVHIKIGFNAGLTTKPLDLVEPVRHALEDRVHSQ